MTPPRSASSPAPAAALAAALLALGSGPAPATRPAAERAMLGGTASRNMVSEERGLPADWDLATGRNLRWSAPLGSQTYGGPVVAGGKVYVGTNNEGRRNPALGGDRGVVMAFDARSGELLWQATHAKLAAGRVNDWPLQGVCSSPAIEGDRLWYVSNRAELVCADSEGFHDGENDGPYTAEADTGPTGADLVWSLDLIGELGVFPHNLAASSPLLVGDLIYAVTGNGVDEGHVHIPAPEAPSFVAVDKRTGKVAWTSAEPGDRILHGSWSSPAHGVVRGVSQVIFAGGDGWVYAFEAAAGKLLWKFDCNPKDSVWELGGSGTRNNLIATPVVDGERVYIAVGQDPEHGEGVGHLYAIDATGSGDVTATGQVWHRGGEDFRRSISTVAIRDGLLYAVDLSGDLDCLDAATGKLRWSYSAYAAVWGSPFVADGKVYLGDEDGDVAILRAGAERAVLRETNLGAAVYSTPQARDRVLYLTSRNRLFAFQEGVGVAATPAPPRPAAPTSSAPVRPRPGSSADGR